MKKAVWIMAVVALALTAAVLPFLPETVPVHFNAAWQPDRWGSRVELLLLPAILFLLSGVWMVIFRSFEKKAADAEDDKVRAEALANRKAAGIAGISVNAVLLLLQIYVLLLVYRAAEGGEIPGSALDKLPFFLVGILFIVLGNIMPKTRLNGVIGFRTNESMYNENTWRRTNRFGGYALVLAGVLVLIANALIPNVLAALVAIMVFSTAAIVATLAYSHRVYAEEKERSEKGEN